MIQKGLRHLVGRREILRAALGSAAGLVGAAIVEQTVSAHDSDQAANAGANHDHNAMDMTESGHGANLLVGAVDHAKNGFDPLQMLVDWDYGKVSTLPDGRTLREYDIVAFDREIEI